MISVADALEKILALFDPLESELVDIDQAGQRVLAQSVSAKRDQPPFASSAMDGYAVKSTEIETGAIFQVIGESAAGSRFDGRINPGQAVRIFTGAPVPDGADRILIQEDCKRQGDLITVGHDIDQATYIRAQGSDFQIGHQIEAPLQLGASEVSILAAMNIAKVPVTRKPVVALVATGDELVHPSETPNPDQIISSNNFGLKAMVAACGGQARILPIARDNIESLTQVLEFCSDADVIVTLGGASVGDHDLMGKMAQSGQLDTDFYKVAMRPGKPLMAGRYLGTPLIGLPGNPVSSLVCAQVFLVPAIRKMLGLCDVPIARRRLPVAIDLPKNGPREHYMRAKITLRNGQDHCQPFGKQDSSLLSVMTQADVLMIRPAYQDPLKPGDLVDTLSL